MSAQNNDGQRAPAPRGRSDEIESARADIARLHAVGAFETADQEIVVLHHGLAVPDALQGKVVRELRELRTQRPYEQGEVARGAVVVRGMQPVGIDEMRVRHAEA